MIDQRLLPAREVYRIYGDAGDVVRAIKEALMPVSERSSWRLGRRFSSTDCIRIRSCSIERTDISGSTTRSMDTLIYKRTHTGDPNTLGVFGCHGCMGRVRRQRFDAVIGIGGKRPHRGSENIAFKITWVGIGPSKTESRRDSRGPLVEFEKFVLWDEAGRDVRDAAPKLFRYMFEDQHVRHVMSRSLAKEMQEEVAAILRFAEEQRDDVRRNRLPRRSEQAVVKSKRALQKRKCER